MYFPKILFLRLMLIVRLSKVEGHIGDTIALGRWPNGSQRSEGWLENWLLGKVSEKLGESLTVEHFSEFHWNCG